LKVEYRLIPETFRVLSIETDNHLSLQSWGDNLEGKKAALSRAAEIKAVF